MSSQALAVLFGTLCSILLTPLVAKLWQRLAPPRMDRAGDLSAEAWRRGDAISNEALIVTALAGVLFLFYEGPERALGALDVTMAVAGILGIPTAWLFLRVRILGRGEASAEFAQYFERKHKISFRSWLYVGMSAFVLCLACLAVSLSTRH